MSEVATLRRSVRTRAVKFLGPSGGPAAARQAVVVASDSTVDRMGDIVEPAGAKLDNFRRNPIILAMHDAASPIARCIDIAVRNNRLEAKIEFPPLGVNAQSDQYCGLLKNGVLSAVSIGFLPIEYKPIPGGGLRFTRWELLEISIVSVPANPSALVIERAGKRSTRAAEDGSDWRCAASTLLNIDSSDDAYDPKAAAAAVLDWATTNDTIDPTEAARAFLAFDASRPLERDAYTAPFARISDDGGRLIACKTAWRAAAARLDELPRIVQADALNCLESYERALAAQLVNAGKSARQRGRERDIEILELIDKGHDLAIAAVPPRQRRAAEVAEIIGPPKKTRAQRLAEVAEIRRRHDADIASVIDFTKPLTEAQRVAQIRTGAELMSEAHDRRAARYPLDA